MPDLFQSHADTVSAPARRLVALTPHDTNDLADVPKAIYVGTTGNVALMAADDSTSVILLGIVQGTVLPVRVKRLLATGTTVTGIVALY